MREKCTADAALRYVLYRAQNDHLETDIWPHQPVDALVGGTTPKMRYYGPGVSDYLASHKCKIRVSTDPNMLASFLPRCGTVHISVFTKQGSSSSHCPAYGDPACACDPHSAERGQGMPALYLNLTLYLLITL